MLADPCVLLDNKVMMIMKTSLDWQEITRDWHGSCPGVLGGCLGFTSVQNLSLSGHSDWRGEINPLDLSLSFFSPLF